MSEQKDNKKAIFTARILQVGTAECAIFFAILAMVLALLFLSLGFWKTVLIAVLVCVGLFLGGVKNKKEWITDRINKLFPPRQNMPYRSEQDDLHKAVKAAVEKAGEAAEAPEEEAEEESTNE